MTANYFQLLPLLILSLSTEFLTSEATLHNGRILGGNLTDFREFPYIAYVKHGYTGSFCTGVLLSMQHILIPTDCVAIEWWLSVVVGTNDPTWNEFSSQSVHISLDELDIVQIPNVELSMLTLPQEFSETSAVKGISIAGNYLPNADYLIVGYPDIYRNSVPPTDGEIRLMKLVTNGNNRTYCTGQLVPDSHLCTGLIHGGSGACATDGGILVRRSNGIDEIYGMIQNQCCGAPRCFDTFWDLTNPSIKNWIEEFIWQNLPVGSKGPKSGAPPFVYSDLGDECINSTECNLNVDAHAICLRVDPLKGQCDCNRGYVQDEFGVSCEKVIGKRCDNDTDCNFNIGDKSGVCTSEDKTCECPPGTILHPKLSICTTKQNFVYTACSSNEDCDQIPLTFCSSLNKTCTCNETISFFSSKSRICSPLPSNLLQACDFDEHCKSLEGVPLNMCRRCSEELGSEQAWGVCKCCEGYVENQNQCKQECASNTGCSSGEYCQLNGGFCQNLKVFNTICEATSECAGYETRNIVCVDRLDNGVKRCNCALGFVPDRPTTDENMNCIELVENVPQCNATDSYGVLWIANPGERKVLPCPGRQNGTASWMCQSNGRFQGSQPNYEDCTTPWVNELNDTLSEIIDDKGDIDMVDATELMTNIEHLLDVAFLSDGDVSDDNENQFFGHEIQTMVDIVNTIVTKMVFNEDPNGGVGDVTTIYEGATEDALKIVEKLLRFNKPWEQLPTASRTIVFSNVLHLIETSAFQLANSVNGSISETEETVYAKSYHQKGFRVTSGITNAQNLVYPLDSGKRKGKDSFIELPPNWQTTIPQRYEGNAFVGMDVDIDYAKRNIPAAIFNAEEYHVETSRSLNSDLLGFSVTSGQEDTKLNDGETVMITFLHDSDSWGNERKKVARKLHPGEKPRAAGGTVQCTRFDEATKVWTTDGCQLVETGPHSTTCACDHLSKYGLQTEYHEYPGKTIDLEIATLFGFGLSTLLQGYKVYTSKAKDLQQNIKTLMMIFVITSNLLLVGFVDRNYFYLSDTWCYIVGLLSHIVGLCALMCLATAGIHIYMFPIKEEDEANTNTNVKQPPWAVYKKWIYAALIAGIPIFISVVTMIVGAAFGENTRVYGGDFCWLDGPYIWAFFGPAIATVIVCAAFYTTFILYIKSEQGTSLQKSEETMKENLLFAVLLGITWAVGFYQLGPHYSDSEVVQFTFPILNGLQGILLTVVGLDLGLLDAWNSFKDTKLESQKKKSEDVNKNEMPNSKPKSRKSNSVYAYSEDETNERTQKKANKKQSSDYQNNHSRDRKRNRRDRRVESDSETIDSDISRNGSVTFNHQKPTTSSHRFKMPQGTETEGSSTDGSHKVATKNRSKNSNTDDEITPAKPSKVLLTSFRSVK